MNENTLRVADIERCRGKKACLHYQTNRQRKRNSDTRDAEQAGVRHIWAENLQKLKRKSKVCNLKAAWK